MLLPRNSKASASCRPQDGSHKPPIHNMLAIMPASGNQPVVPDWGGTLAPRAPKKGTGSGATIGAPPLRAAKQWNAIRDGQLSGPRSPDLYVLPWAPPQPVGACPRTLAYCTELVADPTTTSPVVVSTPGTQPNSPHPPPDSVCNTTWIMFTVMPLVVTPSPVRVCSFRTT
jgi:hypothetical protein